MTKSIKNIILTFIIGCVVFVIGKGIDGGFHFKTINEFLISFGFFQLYSFVLGYSNMVFFDFMEQRTWHKGDTINVLL